jgi:hypothetical protein
LVLFALLFFGLGFVLALLLPWRWVAAAGVAFALGEWYLAYAVGERDDAHEGAELVLVTGLFALAFLGLWLLGIAAALLVRRRRGGAGAGI